MSKILFVLASAVFLVICMAAPHEGFTSDINCWVQWTRHIQEYSLGLIYGTDCNYMPLFIYVLKLYSWLVSGNQVLEHIHYLKYLVLIFDIAAALFITVKFKGRIKPILVFALIALNPSFIYNTIVWGQVDTIHSFFLLVSMYYAWKNNVIISSMAFTTAVLTKMISVIYFPLLAIMWLSRLVLKRDYPVITGAVLLNVGLIILAFYPIAYKTGFSYTYSFLSQKIMSHSNVIAVSSFNFWELIMDGPLSKKPDSGIWMAGVKYKTAGIVFFSSGFLLSIIPLMYSLMKESIDIKRKLTVYCLSFALITLFFFYFKTGIHERYVHSAFIFIAAYFALTSDFHPYLLFSIAYFFQLNNVMLIEKYDALLPFMY